MDRRVAESWDTEYEAGRYETDPPVTFTGDIIAAAGNAGFVKASGLYIGCGNGRNYTPLVAAGLDLIGLDVSGVAINQLVGQLPQRRDRLIHGNLSALPAQAQYPLVIGIQVFQHGDRATAHSHVRLAQKRLASGGLFCLRVNAVGTDVSPRHEITERHEDDGFTVRYLEGPKEGLEIHFFSRSELDDLFSEGFEEILPLRLDRTWRTPRSDGQWSQWEAIWRRRPEASFS